MAITQIIATLPAVLNDSATFYEDIAERNNSLVTIVLPSINAWATQANTTQSEINAKAAQVAAQAVDGGYSQNYINTNFVGVNNAQTIAGVKTFTSSIQSTTTDNSYIKAGVITNGNGELNTVFPSLGFHQPTLYAGTIALTQDGKFSFFGTNGSDIATIKAKLEGNADTVTNGVYTTTNQTIAGVKTFTSSPIVPTPTTGTQAVNKDYADLKVALAGFTGANQSKAQNGYQKLPGGLIIQWGTSLSSLTSTDYRTFPIAFPNACLVGCAGYVDFIDWGGGNAFVIVSKSQFLATSRNSSGALLSSPTLWIAIGY